MSPVDPSRPEHDWLARLDLRFERHGARTVLVERTHEGPLRVQKPFYPEDETVCQVVLVHPPGGVARGDRIELSARLGTGSHAQLTTPGAGKWYRSEGAWAGQQVRFELGEGAVLEWLPQENILFDGARARMQMIIELAPQARYLGWEIHCLGRRAAGEHYRSGRLILLTRVERSGRLLWLERGRVEGGGGQLVAAPALAGRSVCGTFVAAAPSIAPELIEGCRGIAPSEREAFAGVTQLPTGVLLARYLGHSAEAARAWFTALWRLLRPALLGRAAIPPRIWNT
ncbi:MAG: urease accessory protein UreD [Burkholderiales bacterium]|nr:urease accessory protein UreD [Burkholderiales bacterium]